LGIPTALSMASMSSYWPVYVVPRIPTCTQHVGERRNPHCGTPQYVRCETEAKPTPQKHVQRSAVLLKFHMLHMGASACTIRQFTYIRQVLVSKAGNKVPYWSP
jgi:hypothetical protein